MTYQPKEPISCVRCLHRIAVARRLCRSCYTIEHRRGNVARYRVLGPQDVFFSKIEKSDGCWNWSGSKNSYGYGIFLLPGSKPVRAHRYSYEIHKGKIPAGLVVMHSCDNPKCVNPDHLSLGTKLDNNRDASIKGRRPKGESSAQAILTNEAVLFVRASRLPQAQLAEMFGVDQSTISNVVTRKRWRHLP